MKPVAFTYHRAASVAEACALLQADPESVLMAGGQSLMPLLAMRLARPTQVIDILRLPGLDAIAVTDTQVTLGATVRQAAVEHSVVVARELPLLFRAMPWVGHPPNRRRGTVGGSIANGDATAEIGLVAVALGADVLLAGDGHIPAQDFFLGPMFTALPPGTMVMGLRFPRRAAGRNGTGFAEIAQRHGDYAMAAVGVDLALDDDGACRSMQLAVGGAAAMPIRLDLHGLHGTRLDPANVRDAMHEELRGVDMIEDPNTTGSYRRRVAVALAMQAVAQAVAEARAAAETLH